jgi:type I restriction enzyme S subunit
MNDLEKLIQNLCPNGVERIRIGAFAKVQKTKNKGHISEEAYSITQRGLIPTNEFFGEKTKITSSDTSGYYLVYKDWFVYSPSRIDVGSINYLKVNGPVIVSPLDVVFSVDEEKILPLYLLTYLLSLYGMRQILDHRQGIEGTGRRTLPFAELAKVEVPLPPLPIQQRIVEILDKFTSLVSSLDSEIALRQKQYEYYRNKLLSFEEGDAKWKIISDIADNYTGLTYKPANVSETGTLVLRSSNIQDSHLIFEDNVYVQGLQIPHRALVKQDDVLICVRNGSRALIGKCAMIDKASEGMAFGAFMSILRAKDVNPKYLFYVWQLDSTVKQYKGDDAAPINQITSKDFSRIRVQVPSLDKQQRIVRTLDTFESLLTNLKKERELRQKQYEYYREKLLTFA